jgi:hypothetical protein
VVFQNTVDHVYGYAHGCQIALENATWATVSWDLVADVLSGFRERFISFRIRTPPWFQARSVLRRDSTRSINGHIPNSPGRVRGSSGSDIETPQGRRNTPGRNRHQPSRGTMGRSRIRVLVAA